jgi:hypothetical protein
LPSGDFFVHDRTSIVPRENGSGFNRKRNGDSEAARVINDLRGTEKQRTRAEELVARFEEIRRADQLDETAAEMLERVYV